MEQLACRGAAKTVWTQTARARLGVRSVPEEVEEVLVSFVEVDAATGGICRGGDVDLLGVVHALLRLEQGHDPDLVRDVPELVLGQRPATKAHDVCSLRW